MEKKKKNPEYLRVKECAQGKKTREGCPVPEAGVQVSLGKAWVRPPDGVAKFSGLPGPSLYKNQNQKMPLLMQHPLAPSTDKCNEVHGRRREV